MQVGPLYFLDVKGSDDTEPGDLVIHLEYGVGEVVGTWPDGRVTVAFFNYDPEDARTIPATSLGFVRCVNSTHE